MYCYGPGSPDADPRPLECCTSAWQSAPSDLPSVDNLVQEELQQGWIREVAGGLPALREQYRLCAVGKLGLVQAPGRPPRLVVDSSVSAATENTVLPNRSCNPTLAHLRRCLPVGAAREEFTALVLDVSMAHRRIKIRPEDQGLLCFRHRGKLFQCLTLNFGARASSYYWARTAGLLCRLLRRIVYVNHGLMIYVDDLLCLLHKCASPLLAALIVVFLLALNVPMSWRKASLSSHPVWIGWSINLTTFTVCMEAEKQQRLLQLLLSVLQARHVSRHDVERLTGKLLWLSGLFSFLRPTLAPLYSLQHSGWLLLLLISGLLCVHCLTLTSWSPVLSGTPLFQWVPRWCASRACLSLNWHTSPRGCRSHVVSGFRSLTDTLRQCWLLKRSVRCCRSGKISCTNPRVGKAFCWRPPSSVKPLQMHVRTVLLSVWEGM